MSSSRGFTIIEIMIVVVMVAILASIAIPSYTQYVTRSKIQEATSTLLAQRVKMEQFFQDNRTYIGSCAPGTVAPLPGGLKYFTINCGNLAAATSTGGMTDKRWGRVGDSPIIGAGTYADNATCAVSATGSGEYFIRAVVSHEICARVRLAGVSAAEAAHDVVHGTLAKIGGDGGVIVVDAKGAITMEFNTEGMFRAARDSAGRRDVAIY